MKCEDIVNRESEGIWKERYVVVLKYSSIICMERLRRNTKIFYRFGNSNRIPAAHAELNLIYLEAVGNWQFYFIFLSESSETFMFTTVISFLGIIHRPDYVLEATFRRLDYVSVLS
jgi:hypothetical protein